MRNPVSLAEIKNLGRPAGGRSRGQRVHAGALRDIPDLRARMSRCRSCRARRTRRHERLLHRRGLSHRRRLVASAARHVLAAAFCCWLPQTCVLALLPRSRPCAGASFSGPAYRPDARLLAALVADTARQLRGTAYGFFDLLGGWRSWRPASLPRALDIAGPQVTFLAGAGFALVALAAVRDGTWQDQRRSGRMAPDLCPWISWRQRVALRLILQTPEFAAI